MKRKACFITFKDLPLKQIKPTILEGESPTLNKTVIEGFFHKIRRRAIDHFTHFYCKRMFILIMNENRSIVFKEIFDARLSIIINHT